MADTPILNYKGKHDGPEIDKAVELALGLENPESCPYHVHVSLSQPDYVLTIGLGDAEGNIIFNHAEIDLPLESMVVNATYSNGNIILHLQDGTETEPIPISALIAGLVSETRTIAGIDLKDDITSKELRDALGVYTKESVDQLVSDLENTINETLNEMKQSLDDLSELTSEHDTQIKKNTNDILINQETIGTQIIKKNLFNKDGEINSNIDGSITTDVINTVNGNVITFNRNTASKQPTGQFISGIYNRKLIITFTIKSMGTATKVSLRGYARNNTSGILYKSYTETGQYKVEWTATNAEVLFSFINEAPTSGQGLQIENLMIRDAGFTDDAYEPYKPSVNERLVDIEESVSELTPQVEQNKSDILTITNANGVKNILNYNLESIKAINNGSNWVWSDNSVTNAGITFTINSDNTITVTGKLTGQLAYLRVLANFDIAQGTWTLSGCPKGGSYPTYKMYIDGISGFSDYGDTLTKMLDSPTTATFLTISIAGISDNINLLFKPMLCSSEIYNISPNYQPYSLSNAELTALEKQNKNDILSAQNQIDTQTLITTSGEANSKNWYRAFEVSRKGAVRTGIILINRGYSNGLPEQYILSINIGYYANKINLISRFIEKDSNNVGRAYIDKIRIVRATSSPSINNCYIDIHYNADLLNAIYVSILANTTNSEALSPANFSAAEIPEGYTSTEFDLTEKDIFTRISDIETALSQIQTE